MLSIRKEFSFSASHILEHLPEGHPCGRMHGHNYVVVVELRAPESDLDKAGFVRDYRELDGFKRWLDDTVDHRHLNDVMAGLNPSAEHLALWIFRRWRDEFPELSAVSISETPKTWAEYRPLAG
ncbi:6-pyruvoyl trahydropterin synthase family protein [Saccharothrix australiensis]|uniref:6-carboxy-5,6,7,8-tetrahydropterin synthase n=1 Tax=Saccharothrix australiensis TaxID=2072 RepID=A0A495W1T7_9PSEU|nr:6-carboxytetrahydropterin synthase [Saccharothrix australiensis]RKT53828.1 6-pyruvoyltetrahydropterin/6-carboxytetrahydropterin synthase [Saccharothrix australiensis]